MSVPARRNRPAQLAATITLTALVTLAVGACSSDEPAPAPGTAASTTSSTASSSTETSSTEPSSGGTTSAESRTRGTTTGTPTGTTASPSRGSGSGAASTMTCAEFRGLDDAARTAVLRELDVTSNAQQVATVAATVCLTRPDDTIAAVVAELVPR